MVFVNKLFSLRYNLTMNFTEIIIETFTDSIKILPLLFLVYVVIEFIELKYSHNIKEKIEDAGNTGPLMGAVAGAIPQCGLSVIASSLYVRRFISMGTLLAVYLSTSDEAIPMLLSEPQKAAMVLPVIAIKIIIAIIAGYFIDLVLHKRISHHPHHDQSCEVTEHGCCGHDYQEKKITLKKILLHPLIHTLKIFIYIFLVSLILAFGFAYIGSDNIKNFFLSHQILQPIFTAFVGLIPNCAASVAITQFYIEGVISFGAMISGLCASAGLGVLVLFKENKNRQEVYKIFALLLIISIVAGLLIQYL